ncbi:MAG: DNA polymerase III subunit delta' [Gammaproteobacteria bacterium]|nr:DNA polymerase III subunit delta' [Gammaproteobacteria bacterium]
MVLPPSQSLDTFPLPWQSRVWSRLTSALQQNELGHALLLAGKRGTGKRLLAEALAQLLLCQQPQSDSHRGVACGDCPSCQLFRSGNHPDLVWIQPNGEDKPLLEVGRRLEGKDGERQIQVDQIRQLLERFALVSRHGETKVAIIERSEMMNLSAANALLKTLEEPTKGTYLILMTEAPSRLLSTIRSRCHYYPVTVSPQDEMASLQWVAECSGSTYEAVASLASFMVAGPLEIRNLMMSERKSEFSAFEQTVLGLKNGREDPVVAAAVWSRHSGSFFLHAFQLLLLALTKSMYGRGGESASSSNTLERSLLSLFNDNRPATDQWFNFVDQSQKSGRLWQEHRVNRQLLLEELLLSWHYL